MAQDIGVRVDQYVQLRDKIKQLEDAHKEVMAPYKEALNELNSVLLDYLNQIGGDSVKTANGTVYRTVKKSTSIADKEAFWGYVLATQDWDLLDYKANSNAVATHVEEKGQLPPGVNLTATSLVGVRRK